MARQAKKTLIGGFVVGSVALAAAGLVVFGSGRFFQKRVTFVMFFSGSITGLSVGSAVEFRGVRVGQVTKIAALFDPKDVSIAIPVYIEIDPKSLIISGSEDASSLLSTSKFHEPLLEKGLKAQLDIELIRAIATEVKPLMASLTATSDKARSTFAQAEKTLSMQEGPSAEMAASFIDAMTKAGASLDQMRSTLGSYQKVAVQNANVGYDLAKTLGDLDAAARTVRSLAEYLQLHPEAVLKGKK